VSRRVVAALVACLLLIAGCSGDDDDGDAPDESLDPEALETDEDTRDPLGTQPVNAGTLTFTLAGPTGGAGEGSLTVEGGQLCVSMTVTGIDAPTGAHIHAGADGETGPELIALGLPEGGALVWDALCSPVVADQIGAVAATPADYYLDIHTAAAPDGAVRGQLRAVG
jgi:hypothetical protein